MLTSTRILAVRRYLQRTMMMKMKPADQQKHRHNPAHHPARRLAGCLPTMQRMRQQVKNTDPQHQTAHKTDDRLAHRVSQIHQRRNPATQQRCQHNRCTVTRQQQQHPPRKLLIFPARNTPQYIRRRTLSQNRSRTQQHQQQYNRCRNTRAPTEKTINSTQGSSLRSEITKLTSTSTGDTGKV